jgi:hypothetical protein
MLPASPDLFEQVPRGFFGPLSGPLAPIYWAVLARFYQYEFERDPFFLLKETALEVIQHILRESPVWNERREEFLDEGPIDQADEAEAERQAARRMLERLEKSGWVHFEYRSSAGGAVLNFHAYAARTLEVLMRTARGEQPILQGYAHSIATLLKPDTFAGSPGLSLSEARRNTLDLVRELKILNRNMQAFTQKILDSAKSAASILEEGIGRYHSAVMTNYHRLKTVDNLFKWRTRILDRLERIHRDRASLDAAIAWIAESYGCDLEEAKQRLEDDLQLMRSQFETLPEIADDLDRRNARFSGVALRKLMYLLRQDRRTEAQLQYLVDHLAIGEEISIEFDVFKCALLGEGFLYTPRKKRAAAERVALERHADGGDPELLREQAAQRVRRVFGRKKMEERIAELLAERDSVHTEDLPLESDEDYVGAMYTAAYGLDGRSSFRFEVEPSDRVESGRYRIPRGRIMKRRRKRT